MSALDRMRYAGRRVFGAVKRPIFDAVRGLTGQRVHSKAEYLDFGMYGGAFEAPTEAVERRLSPGFEIVERRPGWTEIDVWAADYRRVDIMQPYRELGVLVPVRLRREGQAPIEGQYVLQMIVTTEEARWTGVDIHGFPKIVADVDVEPRDGVLVCTARHRGVHVLTLRVQERATAPLDDCAVILNVRGDGRLIRSDFDRHGEVGVSERPEGVSLQLGTHAIADQLRQIGLRGDSGRAIYLPRCRGVLHKAVDLGPLAADRAAADRPPLAAPALRPA